jgi:LacI family transcriptional regulator
VRADNEQVGQLAAGHFLERGLRHFAFVGHLGQLVSNEREAAFRRAIEARGFTLAAYHDRKTRAFDPVGRRWPLDRGVQRWLRDLPKPVGILAQSDLFGVQLTEACRQAGMHVPEDVAILGVDNDDLYCELSRPALSSIVLPTERIGYEAAALLERLLDGKQSPSKPLLLRPVGVVTRRSTETMAIDDPDVVAAVRLIRENAHLPLRAADVLKHVPVGRRSLERHVRRCLGHGLGAEIRRVHLERAKRLLIETELPIKSVAEQSGFTDFRHMAVVFRKDLGLSPTAFRRQA